jgi:hypothetical protein
VGVLVEVQRGVLGEVQGIQGTCGETIRVEDQGVSVQQWRGVHFQGIPGLLEGTRHWEANLHTI